MHKTFLKIAFVIGAVSVALGAFGAHALKKIVDADILNIYETAIRYQLYHAIAIALAGIVYKEFDNKFVKIAGKLFLVGIIFFSGSLYLLCYLKANNLSNFYWIGAITPLGGLAFISGWLLLAKGIYKNSYE
jgi:uncharacterized membrane protein YgdD (TMEM256/DUF423 family)